MFLSSAYEHQKLLLAFGCFFRVQPNRETFGDWGESGFAVVTRIATYVCASHRHGVLIFRRQLGVSGNFYVWLYAGSTLSGGCSTFGVVGGVVNCLGGTFEILAGLRHDVAVIVS